MKSLDKSSSALKIVTFYDQETSKEKPKLKTEQSLRPQTRQITINKSRIGHVGEEKKKPPLKI